MLEINNNALCLCGSKQIYAECCKPYHQQTQIPDTAEKLMRSRFSAYELHLTDYLLFTWDKITRPGSIEYTPGLHWTKLSLNGRKKGRKKDAEGWVTFIAYYQLNNGEAGSMHEKSYFRKNEIGHWKYVDGEVK
ncbi:YchJ family metal-binding protein [Thiomicrorhabdus hydrogeniphila]